MNTSNIVALSPRSNALPPQSPKPRYRLLLTFEGDTVIRTEIVRDDQFLMSPDEYQEILLHAGYRVIPPRRKS